MSQSSEGKVRFSSSIVVKWVIAGAVAGLIFAVLGLIFGVITSLSGGFQSQGMSFPMFIGSLFIAPFGGAFSWTIWGIIGLLLDGAVNHGWKFREIEYHPWVWYFYPLISAFAVAIGLVGGIIKMIINR